VAGDIHSFGVDPVIPDDFVHQLHERIRVSPDFTFCTKWRHDDKRKLSIALQPMRKPECADTLDIVTAQGSAMEVQNERPSPSRFAVIIRWQEQQILQANRVLRSPFQTAASPPPPEKLALRR
jgi:hypothetical protein